MNTTPKKYNYFVSYSFSSGKFNGFGCTNMEMSKRITSYADIVIMIGVLNQMVKDPENNSCLCVVMNYQLFSEDSFLDN